MELEEFKQKFNLPRINSYLDKMGKEEAALFWQAFWDIKQIFPKLDIYLGNSGNEGYIGIGVKTDSNTRVKSYIFASMIQNNKDEKGKYVAALGLVNAFYNQIKEDDELIKDWIRIKDLSREQFKEWLIGIKNYAIKYHMILDGQGLLPTDYTNQKISAAQAIEFLKERYPNTYSGTTHIAAFRTSLDRQLALDPKTKTTSIFCDAQPDENLGLYVKTYYDIDKTRNHHLSTHAPNLDRGYEAYLVSIDTLEELEKFCYWYEQYSDKITVLEHKIKSFLELWPVERLKHLTIEEYHQAKSKDCFIAQIDSFDPTQGGPTFACYFDIWEPVGLGDNKKYHNKKPYSWNKRLGDNLEQAFQRIKREILDIIDAVQHRDLNAIDQIQFTQGLKWMIAFLYQDFSSPCVIPVVGDTNIKRIGYESYVKTPLSEFLPILLTNRGEQAFFPYVEKLFAMIRKGYLGNKQKLEIEELVDDVMIEQPLNRILFGAAGTGKTYHTINHALSIIEDKSLEDLKLEEREDLKNRFDEYKDKGQIKFVTFHQSFSYEDFVEGIRAETVEDSDGKKNIEYSIISGVFKSLCDDSKREVSSGVNINLPKPIEFGRGYSLKEITNEVLEIQKPNGNIFHLSRKLSDYLVKEFRNGKFSIHDLIQKNAIELVGNDPILEPYLINGYNTVWANLIPLLDQLTDQKAFSKNEKVKYVLIIDEINRGNISRIFGELITLVEESKRQGAEEELSVTLPYSKYELTVPKNLYLIGTMNSSDRSLTGLDIALRRRFTFIEMPPKPEEIKDKNGVLIEIHGKDQNGDNVSVIVAELLKVMNQRIEVLLDRDHCIGHANFMSLRKQPTLENLAHIFKQKIIPQLQEYFFDDWSKISLVLFQNGMISEDNEINISSLFPENAHLDMDYSEQKKIWKINDAVFETIDAFIKILGTKG